MKKGAIILIFLIICISISHARVIYVPGVEEPEQLRDEFGTKKFVYAGNNIVASVKDSGVEYYHQGRLSNRITTDSGGVKESEFKSLPFGQNVLNTGVDYPFTGKKEDESSLYYFGARYYDDNLGRFISVDPVRENEPYSYVRNNPIMLVDPTGMDEEGVPPVMSHEFGIDHLMNQETQDFLNRNDPEYMMNRFYEERYLQMEQGKEQLNLIVPYRSLRRINEAHMRGEQADVGDYVNFISAGMLWATGLIKAGNAMRGLSFGRLGSVRTPSNLGRGMPVRSSNLIESLETGLKGERKSLPEVLKVFDDHLASGALDPISHQAYVEGTVELAFTEVQGHVVSPHTAARLMVRASQNGLATNAASPATGGRNIMSSILSEGKQTVYSNGAIEYNLNNNLLIIREPETSMISTFISRQ